MGIDYHNMPNKCSKTYFIVNYVLNLIRTFLLFHLKYPWVKYNGFVRVMSHTTFAKMDISIGQNVQFGQYCNIASNIEFKNNILIAGRVCIVGKNDHTFNVPGRTIWNGTRDNKDKSIIEDDVWIGNNVTIVGPVIIGCGSIVAAGAVVTKDIPPCEIWGGCPAKKIKNRFFSDVDKAIHMEYLSCSKDSMIDSVPNY